MAVVEISRIGDGVTLLTLNRPSRLNAITEELLSQLKAAIDAVREDESCRVVILTGAGGAFCSGLDVKEEGAAVAAEDPSSEGLLGRIWAAQERVTGIALTLNQLRQPVIAAIDGVAVGGGFGWSLACDLRIGSTRARLGAVFMNIGLSNLDVGTSYFLPRIVGAGRAMELLLTARVVPADVAERIGLLNEVVSPERLLDRALEVAREIAAHTPFGVWMTKQGAWTAMDAPSLQHAVQLEYRTQMLGVYHDDLSEAVKAFLTDGTPTWKTV